MNRGTENLERTNMNDNGILPGASGSRRLRSAPESSEWATDPDRGSHGQERRAASRLLGLRHRLDLHREHDSVRWCVVCDDDNSEGRGVR